MLSFYTKHEALNRPTLEERWCQAPRTGYDEIAAYMRDRIAEKGSGKTIRIAMDGYLGVAWEHMIARLLARLSELGVECVYKADLRSCFKEPAKIEGMVQDCFAHDSHWGRVYDGTLQDFFDPGRLEKLRTDLNAAPRIPVKASFGLALIYGTGAALPMLADACDIVVYVDLTKKEMLHRFDEHKALLLGAETVDVPEKRIARRLPYVDFPVVHPHKKSVLKRMDWIILSDKTEAPLLVPADAYHAILGTVAVRPFRPLPFYFPRIWGGKYMIKQRELPMPRCSFCIEVTQRNQSIRILVGNTVMEVQFLNLLWNSPREILGQASLDRFGEYFPITLNYDDNYHGGSLAIQNHPGRDYMRELFNEMDTHDEMYYVVKAWKGAKTYHGLRDGADLEALRALAEKAEREGVPFDFEAYINSWDYPGTVHDLYLHPAGTVHASGVNQLVLEIDFDGSREGQEYTFHLYDYLRKDLDGTLRGIHIDHFFHELRAERTRSWIPGNLKQEPRLLRSEPGGGREYVIGDYHEMYYKVHRLELRRRMHDDTAGQFHVLSLVAGDRLEVRSVEHPDRSYEIGYTESVILPAATGAYELVSRGKGICKVTKALMR
jgi:mannose-6-phosphate isomerase class I